MDKNDDRFVRIFLGDNVETGTIRLMAYVAAYVMVVGGIFALLW